MTRWISHIAAALLIGVTLGSCEDGPTDPSPVCTASFSPAAADISSDGGAGSVQLTMSAASCTWSIARSADWVTIPSSTGTGTATVQYTVAANPSTEPRTATLTVGEATHTVRQAGRIPVPVCVYEITPTSARFEAAGGKGTVVVNAVPETCTWTAASNAAWVAITSGSQGTGPGVVQYEVAPNSEMTMRVTTIAVQGRSLEISQEPMPAPTCDYTVSPVQLNPCLLAGSVSTTITTTSPTCTWTVATNVPWLTPSLTSGSGTTTIDLSFSSNYDAPREGTAMVRWPTPTAGQNVFVAQAGCVYFVSRESFNFSAAAGSSSFEVLQQAVPNTCGGPLQNACVWTPASDVPWITIVNPVARQGDDVVTFHVAANSGSSSRTGRIFVRDKTVEITQAGLSAAGR